MALTVRSKTIAATLGETWVIDFAAVDAAGAALDCSGSPAPIATVTLFTPGGDEIATFADPEWTDQAAGEGKFVIAPAARVDAQSPPQALDLAERVYGYRVRVETPDGSVYDQNAGDLTLEA